jgi:hypothetical protein
VGCFVWVVVDRELTKVTGNRRLATARAHAEADDPDWTWERLNAARPKPPEGKNGADLIPRIKKLTPDAWGKEFATPEWQADLEVPSNVRYAPRVLDRVRAELNGAAEAVTLARALQECPFGYRTLELKPNVFDTLLPDTQHTRSVFNLLRWDAALAVEDGNPSRAAEDLLALLNASRSIGDEPFLISQLVRMAGRGVLVKAVEGDRATFDRLFENLQAGDISAASLSNGTSSQNPLDRLSWWHYRANLPGDRAFALKWMSSFVEAARRPIHEQPALVAAIPPPPKDPSHVMSRLLLPAVEKVAQAHWRTTALERCAVLGIACERFRQKHHLWPNDLNELVPAFVSEIPLDPYDGRPLRYAKTDSGVVVFSVGKWPANQARPGVPVAPSGLPDGIEIGFPLWDQDRRRQPAPPQPQPEPLP